VFHRYLMPLAARLADHQPTHVVDLPGFGLSSDPNKVLDVAEHADHVAAWLKTTQLLPVVVLGNSSGCQVAVDLAVRYPNCICGLILVGPHGRPGGTDRVPPDPALAARHPPRGPAAAADPAA
jgi:pimeloyl-ACP methyl ester carboxylesterase